MVYLVGVGDRLLSFILLLRLHRLLAGRDGLAVQHQRHSHRVGRVSVCPDERNPFGWDGRLVGGISRLSGNKAGQ